MQRPANRRNIPIGVPDDHIDPVADPLGDDPHGPQVVLDKLPVQQQVLGRVANDGQLGEDHELRPRRPRPADELDDLPGVPPQVAHRRVDLCKRDAHGSVIAPKADRVASPASQPSAGIARLLLTLRPADGRGPE